MMDLLIPGLIAAGAVMVVTGVSIHRTARDWKRGYDQALRDIGDIDPVVYSAVLGRFWPEARSSRENVQRLSEIARSVDKVSEGRAELQSVREDLLRRRERQKGRRG